MVEDEIDFVGMIGAVPFTVLDTEGRIMIDGLRASLYFDERVDVDDEAVKLTYSGCVSPIIRPLRRSCNSRSKFSISDR